MEAIANDTTPLTERFNAYFKCDPVAQSFAPGRINLLGEHVDYMGGTVLPASVTQGVTALCNPRIVAVRPDDNSRHPNGILHVACTADGGSEYQFDTAELAEEDGKAAQECTGWRTYIRGIILEVGKQQKVDWSATRSAAILVDGNIPLGAGMSSSAALCVAVWQMISWIANKAPVDALSEAAQSQRAPEELANVATSTRAIEVEYCKVNIGIMDQFISVHGKEGHFLELQCNSLSYKLHKLPQCIVGAQLHGASSSQPQEQQLNPKFSFILVNSMVKHKLGDEYNYIRQCIESAQSKLRDQREKDDMESGCEPASRFSFSGAVENPREFGLEAKADEHGKFIEELFDGRVGLAEDERAMGQYVVEEMLRTRQFVELIEKLTTNTDGDEVASIETTFTQLGQLLNATHAGLSKQLKVSTEHLDFIQEHVNSCKGGMGARMMGGGFGGCVLVLLRSEAAQTVVSSVQSAFQAQYPGVGSVCECYPVEIGDGAKMTFLLE